jgi:hypothetical protein
VTGDREERNRVLGFPVGSNTRLGSNAGPRQDEEPRPIPRAYEPQRVLGFPADWLGQFGRDPLGPLVHAIREARRSVSVWAGGWFRPRP